MKQAFPPKNLTTFYHPVKSAPYFYHANQFKLSKKKIPWEANFVPKRKEEEKKLVKGHWGEKKKKNGGKETVNFVDQ